MKKQILGLLILALLTIHCGGGGGSDSSTSGSYKTNVEIVLQTTRSASAERAVQKETSQIPAGIVTVRFTISAPDMDTIQREVPVVGKTTIVETFQVPVGPNRLFLIEAIDSAGNVVFKGSVYATVGGIPLTLSVTLESTDPVAPVFGGLSNIEDITSNSLVLSWTPAADNLTPQSNLQYLIYTSTSPGGENVNGPPTYVTPAGATSYQVTNLSSYTTYYFIVRAKDERGNIDQNMVEKSATTLDGIPPTFAGLSSAVALSANSIQLSWSAATDNKSLPQNIVYLIYLSTTPGGENFSSPNYQTPPGVTSYTINGLTPSTTYFFVVRAKDERGNIDQNTVEKSATTLDGTPPGFAGLSSAVALSENSIQLSWGAATDNESLSQDIVYLIYLSTTSKGQNFSSPNFTTSAGATSYTINGLTPSTTYYFVVHARDKAGNEEQNSVEKAATTLDGIPPGFAGLSSAVALSTNSIQLSWSAATDNTSLPQNIVYLIYLSTTPGGENFSSPNYQTPPGATSYTVNGLTPSTDYFFVVRAKDERGNIDKNMVEKSATTLQPSVPSTLSNPVYSLVGLNNFPDPGEGLPYSTFNIGFDYSDVNGDANAEAGATLRLQAQFIDGFYYDNDVTYALSKINGYSGSVRFDVHLRWDITTSVVETFTLTDGDGNISNALRLSIERPEGAN